MIAALQILCYLAQHYSAKVYQQYESFSASVAISLFSMAVLGICTQHLLCPSPHSTFAQSGPHKAFCASVKRRHSAVKITAHSESSFPEGLINQISVAVTNFSPANAVKKAIAAAQAGQYDEEAVSGKVDAYIGDNPVRTYHCTLRQ